MSVAIQEPSFTITTEVEPSAPFASSSTKYPHTRAVLAAIAASIKSDGTEPVDTYADGDERINLALVSRVVTLLQDEKEDELKAYLKEAFSIPDSMDETQLDQNVLELMHKHRDDISGVPFLFLTPTKRPTSRPSSRASTNSFRLAPNRPDTPNSGPNSPLLPGFRRPHTPVTSPLATTSSSYMTAAALPGPVATSASSSPLSSPRLLNAKAVEFRPIQRPLSAGGSSTGARTDTPSPDLWAHNPTRVTSNLAIAAPLVPGPSYTPATRSLTPNSSVITRSSNLDEDYEDEFDPFSTKPRATPPSFPSTSVLSDPEPWSTSSNSTSSRSTLGTSPPVPTEDDDLIPYNYQEYLAEYDNGYPQDYTAIDNQGYEEQSDMLTDGMTPFDVLSSVFGPSLSTSELTEALEMNGYEFESTMAWLMDKAIPVQNQVYAPTPAPRPQQIGGRIQIVPREAALSMRGRGGFSSLGGRNSPRYGTRPAQGVNRVCRYFLAGECMRADCRFSHDLERALCRFWLRGNCAKQESCEFLHHLPKDVDISSLIAPMSGTSMDHKDASPASTPPPDDFPTLSHANIAAGRGRGYQQRIYQDPGRARFAAAVKSQPNPILRLRRPDISRGFAGATNGQAGPSPRPSPRIKLRPSTLLPTLPTGESINNLYMSYRQRAIQLGAARNACLSRAADAWRRGDGAAAKRFSREGHELNAKMGGEAAEAAGRIVKERVRLAAEAVRTRDTSWSDDSRDRSERGKVVAAGLGVVMGIASKDVGSESGGVKATPEERTEVLLDLHGLHSNEAIEVLEKFLITLEKEGFFGLAFIVVGKEKHTGTQDPARGASGARLAAGVREWLHDWGYPWSERDGIICVDPLTHAS